MYSDFDLIKENSTTEKQRALCHLLLRIHETCGEVPEGKDDEKTWELFSHGLFSHPLFPFDYSEGPKPCPKDFDDLVSYVAKGFFVSDGMTVDQFLFLVAKQENKPTPFIFREDVDTLLAAAFPVPAETIQNIVHDIRNPAREEKGKEEFHTLCQTFSVSEENEKHLLQLILLARPTITKKQCALLEARKVYRLAYYQAHYPEEYAHIQTQFNLDRLLTK